MNVDFFYKHMATSPALTSYTQDRLEQELHKFELSNLRAEISFAIENKKYIASCQLHGPKALHIQAKGDDPTNMYAAVEAMLSNLDRLISKEKGKMTEHRDRASVRKIAETIANDDVEDEPETNLYRYI